MYADTPLFQKDLLSEVLQQNHAEALECISQPGDFFTGEERIEMVECAREALTCPLCTKRQAALSPNSITGQHDQSGVLSPVVVDIIHRVRTDPGRLTESWFKQVTTEVSKPQYIEIVSVIAASVIIDTLHNALGFGVPQLPPAKAGKPRGEINSSAVDEGAWVPILQRELTPAHPSSAGRPQTWNITRALGLVPSALTLFFTTFRPHYALHNVPLSISQAQAEFVASRVSALNECFY